MRPLLSETFGGGGDSMADAEAAAIRTDGLGRSLVCEARSHDGAWHVEVFGPHQLARWNGS